MPFALFQLPTELRLEIFSHCTAFNLLNLTRTSSSLRTEILHFPSIYRTSYGFNTASPKAAQLTIHTIDRVRHKEEYDLIMARTRRRWKWIFANLKTAEGEARNLVQDVNQWVCCGNCFGIRRVTRMFSSDGVWDEGVVAGDACFGCIGYRERLEVEGK
ncbi:hypothetical protein BJ508DRAFT_325526 [Ascobolus immersus RN42]|uniref:F-box domain-containing protein n=1 Tax=Ascobolus immersus RN42 TaxID=1160509 RepID=A0A3N4IAP4_ASCIM|nr:hypothetical protein BJ508DRAFT_325526 [Ascobolus immersus RN42]